MTGAEVLMVLLLGAAGGFPLGRWTAEVGRARHEAKKVWDTRSAYRNRGK